MELVEGEVEDVFLVTKHICLHEALGFSVKRVLLKLGLRDRIHAVIFGYESGINQP